MARKQAAPPEMTAADYAVGFMNNLTHTKGEFAGKPFHLRGWQEFDIIRPFFGTINPNTGFRQYRELYIEIPRKNGKSELAAAIILYLLFADGEMGAEIYSAAADKGQAGKIFEVCAQMVRNDPELAPITSISNTQQRKHMGYYLTGSFYTAVGKIADSQHGGNSHGVVIDEYHTLKSNALVEVLTTSQGARRQPVIIYITTAGEERRGPAWNMHTYALKVKEDPSLDPTFLPIIYAAAEGADWTDPAVWKAANPALGDFRYEQELHDWVRKAKEMPAYVPMFKRLFLNIWPDGADKAIDMNVWRKNQGTNPDGTTYSCGPQLPEFLKGRKCYAGLDLASVSDFAALVLFFPGEKDANGNFTTPCHIHCFFWVPEDTIHKRSEIDKLFYRQWAKKGFITATPGNVTDYGYIRNCITGTPGEGGKRAGGIIDQVQLVDIGTDPFNATHLINELTEDGFVDEKGESRCRLFRQGFLSMNAPTKELLRLILQNNLAHGANPVLEWMIGNLVLETDAAGNFKPSKSKSAEKIDGVVSLVMAIGRWLADNQPRQRSRFESPSNEG